VRGDGRTLTPRIFPSIEEITFRFLKTLEWDVSELSFGKYISLCSQGLAPIVAIPVFPSRVHRHSAIYVRRDSGIRSAKDIEGRAVGILLVRLLVQRWGTASVGRMFGPVMVVWFAVLGALGAAGIALAGVQFDRVLTSGLRRMLEAQRRDHIAMLVRPSLARSRGVRLPVPSSAHEHTNPSSPPSSSPFFLPLLFSFPCLSHVRERHPTTEQAVAAVTV